MLLNTVPLTFTTKCNVLLLTANSGGAKQPRKRSQRPPGEPEGNIFEGGHVPGLTGGSKGLTHRDQDDIVAEQLRRRPLSPLSPFRKPKPPKPYRRNPRAGRGPLGSDSSEEDDSDDNSERRRRRRSCSTVIPHGAVDGDKTNVSGSQEMLAYLHVLFLFHFP
jgi:hypothetical protein